jgi:hypothetical protein
MKNMGQSSSPHKACFGDDKQQPDRTILKPQKTNQTDANGRKSQLHLEPAAYGPANSSRYLICVEDESEETADN